MNLFTIFCENRNKYYLATSTNDVTLWTKNLLDASRFNNLDDAKQLIVEFKNSAMGDTKYLIAREIEISAEIVDDKLVWGLPHFKETMEQLNNLTIIK